MLAPDPPLQLIRNQQVNGSSPLAGSKKPPVSIDLDSARSLVSGDLNLIEVVHKYAGLKVGLTRTDSLDSV